MTPTPAVRVEHLAVDLPHLRNRFHDPTRALEDADLHAPEGMITALVGSNGAGKTTLLRALVGAVRPVAGTIEVLGSTVGPAELPAPPGVALVPDEPLLPGEWHARDVVALHRRLGDDFDEQAFLEMLGSNGIRPKAMIRSLSAGRATIFSLAHALATGPRLLLLDEPLARLDPLARATLIDLLRDLLAEDPSRSIVLSTHDLEGMDRFADHLMVLHAGRTVLEGAVDELLEEHVVATSPMASEAPPGTRPLGASGAAELLMRSEDAVGLPSRTALRTPDLGELVRLTLAARTTTGAVR